MCVTSPDLIKKKNSTPDCLCLTCISQDLQAFLFLKTQYIRTSFAFLQINSPPKLNKKEIKKKMGLENEKRHQNPHTEG